MNGADSAQEQAPFIFFRKNWYDRGISRIMRHTRNLSTKGKIKYEKEKNIDDRNGRDDRLQNNAERT